jgi:large subunit ribosomal protein L7/L12
MADINRLVEELGKLTVIEAGELSKKLEKAWNLDLNNLMSQPQAVQQEEKEEASLFKVILTGFAPDKKISVIKSVRAFKDMGLLEAKNFVEDCPGILKEDIEKEEAEKLQKELEAAGGEVELK